MSLETFEKVIAGYAIFFIVFMLIPFVGANYIGDDNPDPLRRFLTGLKLTLGPIIYFWPDIHHFTRWWLPAQSLALQSGTIALISFVLVIFGRNIECGLLAAGFSSKGQGHPRDFGMTTISGIILLGLCLVYSLFATAWWAISFIWGKLPSFS